MKIAGSCLNVLLIAAGYLFTAPVFGQQWPARAVRIIVPFPPGQAADIIARAIAERLSPAIGQQVFIDNRPGAAGSIGTELAAKAPPDGYTLLAGGVRHLPSIRICIRSSRTTPCATLRR